MKTNIFANPDSKKIVGGTLGRMRKPTTIKHGIFQNQASKASEKSSENKYFGKSRFQEVVGCTPRVQGKADHRKKSGKWCILKIPLKTSILANPGSTKIVGGTPRVQEEADHY